MTRTPMRFSSSLIIFLYANNIIFILLHIIYKPFFFTAEWKPAVLFALNLFLSDSVSQLKDVQLYGLGNFEVAQLNTAQQTHCGLMRVVK